MDFEGYRVVGAASVSSLARFRIGSGSEHHQCRVVAGSERRVTGRAFLADAGLACELRPEFATHTRINDNQPTRLPPVRGKGLVPMSVFSDLRSSLVADLPDLNVSPSWPVVLSPPCGFITPPLSDVFVEAGPSFGGEFTVALDLVLLVAHDDAATSLAELEDMVVYALTYTADWAMTGVDSPAPTAVTEKQLRELHIRLRQKNP